MRLVDSVGSKYRLSTELLKIAGPFWRDTWNLHNFVSHLVSHFDDHLEHLLDDLDEEDPGLFDVSIKFCGLLSDKYGREFLPLPAEWYRELFRSKLESMDVPVELVTAARQSYLLSTFDHRETSISLLHLLEDTENHVSTTYVGKLMYAANCDGDQAWTILEDVVESLIRTKAVSEDDIRDWMDQLSVKTNR